MIKNIVFDLVGVLMRFDTEEYYRRHGISPAYREIIQREVFRSMEWALQDRGAIREEDAAAAICARMPERLHEAVVDFIYRRNRAVLPIPGMETLLKELKSAGFRLFLLSNTSAGYPRFLPKVRGIELFEDRLISCDAGLVKPDPAFFRLALERFGIEPSESAFIDDTPINAEAAHYVGMRAFIFNGDVQALRTWLEGQTKEIQNEAK